MIYGYEDLFTILLSIIAMFIVGRAQLKINNAYGKYRNVKSNNKLTGVEVARKILDANGLTNVYVLETSGTLTDHYDPTKKVVRLSKEIFNGDSIASVSVAAHECGHAIQDKEGYTFMKIRAMLVPIVNLVSYVGYFSIIISLIAGVLTYLKLGIFILIVTLLFQLVTLPVEFDASKRAKKQLTCLEITTKEEDSKVDTMLDAAANTYVASLLSTVINIIRLVIMVDRNKKE